MALTEGSSRSEDVAPKVVKIDQTTALDLADLSRLVAIRWDLVQWGLVLDLDCSEFPDGDGDSRRGWLVFEGVSELTWSLRKSRLPTGLMLTSAIEVSTTESGMREYCIRHLAPTLNERDEVEGNPANILTISAQSMSGFISSLTVAPKDSWPSYEERNALATDADFLFVLGQGSV
jgi:hypothetical protein